MAVEELPSYSHSAETTPLTSNYASNDDAPGRIPTYEGAVHGVLPRPEQVAAYMRLIDGVSQFLKSLERDAELLYMYLATAEQRYLQFLKMRPHSDFIPPMDVAIIWLCHLVRSYSCCTDEERSLQVLGGYGPIISRHDRD